ncbi:MAG: MarR family transcriptional regulator [Anaerolineales bacterium]|nr:MarR family transcriptional regulator [Anaerolineales bacterium]MCZ2123326.1 MarR family transcriptional regulator [Anaerolineales bacterium]
MTKSLQFNQSVRAWMDVFMQRSMSGWKLFAKSCGLSMPQFSILMQLHHKGAFSMSEVRERFEITAAAASQLVDKLVQNGFVLREEDPNDRRAKLLNLTDKGRDLVQRGAQERYHWIDGISARLSEADKAKVSVALGILTEAVQALEQERDVQKA